MQKWEDDLRSEIDDLRKLYIAALIQRRRELDEAVTAYRKTPSDPACWKTLRDLTHRLRGSAGSYGFGRISLAAERLEDWLSAHQAAPLGTDEALREFDDMVVALAHEMDHPKVEDLP